jgi:L-malate glycosyltransferase
MKILYLQMFPLHGSGSGTYARELAQEVSKRHEVAMVVPDSRAIPNVKMYPIKLPVKIAFTGHPDWPNCQLYTKVSGKDLTSNYLAYFHAITAAIEDFKPNIIHVHHLMPLTWIMRFVRIAHDGMNYIVTAHGSELPTLENDKRYPYLTGESLAKASRLVANSFWTKAWIKKVFGNDFNHKMRMIPGGVDPSLFPETKDTTTIDEKYGLAGKKVVLFSGKLTKYKGVKYLIQAAKQIDAMICIAGDGPERKSLEKLAKDLKVKNVKFCGLVQNGELIKFYYRADVCVVPSVWDEPLGLVVLEAMVTKTPVVVTRKGGIPLLVKDGVNGLFIRPRNSKEIAEKVNILFTNEQLRTKIGIKARQTVLEKFTWDKIASGYEQMYEEFKKNLL